MNIENREEEVGGRDMEEEKKASISLLTNWINLITSGNFMIILSKNKGLVC